MGVCTGNRVRCAAPPGLLSWNEITSKTYLLKHPSCSFCPPTGVTKDNWELICNSSLGRQCASKPLNFAGCGNVFGLSEAATHPGRREIAGSAAQKSQSLQPVQHVLALLGPQHCSRFQAEAHRGCTSRCGQLLGHEILFKSPSPDPNCSKKVSLTTNAPEGCSVVTWYSASFSTADSVLSSASSGVKSGNEEMSGACGLERHSS